VARHQVGPPRVGELAPKRRVGPTLAVEVIALALGPCLAFDSAAQGGASETAAFRRTTDIAALWNIETEQVVQKGLAWLAAQQQPSGCWVGALGHKQESDYLVFRSAADLQRVGQGHMGLTALATMAFLAGGHQPDRGKYGAVVAKALAYVLDHVGSSGLITDGYTAEYSGTPMYSHAFATLMLAEIYGMSRNHRIKEGLERAVHLIVDCQNLQGAWRYNPFSQQSDLSVTVCQLQALRAARNIGIQVPVTTIERAVAYVRASQVPRGRDEGLFYYKIYGASARSKPREYAINAAAVTALTSAGVFEPALLAPPVEFLMAQSREVMARTPEHFYFWYGNYYACQALYQADTEIQVGCFARYYEEIRTHLVRTQGGDGRWRNTVGPGDVLGTSVACIVLQIPMQYLPIFQR
jgi:hypothetical protein